MVMLLLAESSCNISKNRWGACMQGFALFMSLGGGTGSGLGSLLLESLAAEYPRKPKLAYTVFPSPQISTAGATHPFPPRGPVVPLWS
eukprot:2333886-Pyramimonas_sp.AAC.1